MGDQFLSKLSGMSARFVGAHMPSAGSLGDTLRSGCKIGCTAVQVFTSSPRQWYAKEVTGDMIADFKRAMVETEINEVISHDTYLINLCAPTPEIRDKSIASLKKEITRCGQYGIPYVVSHMGAHKDQEIGGAVLAVAEATKEILAETPESVFLLMETTAGQGSSLNDRFEGLAVLLELCGGHPRLGVCLDTCHVFAAGYDIRTEEGFEKTFQEFEALVGLDRLKAIHLNDSQKGLGSRIDRHAHIGKGEIGLEPFRILMNDPRFESVPMTLETPDADTMHSVNLQMLKNLRNG